MQRILSFLSILISTVLVVHNTIAQEIKVVSSADNSPLPFATVTSHSRPLVISADKNGVANLKASIGDTLSVSYIGYKTAVILFSGDKLQVVRLVPSQKLLPAITIQNCRKVREFNYDNFRATKDRRKQEELQKGFGGLFWTKGNNSRSKFAVRLNPLKTNARLKEFSFWIEKEQEAPEASILTPLLIGLYEVADSTNLPGELISNVPIFYYPEKSGKQTIKLDTLYVRIPPNGIYVSLQYIMNEEYEWEKVTKWKDTEQDSILRDTVITRYGNITGSAFKGL